MAVARVYRLKSFFYNSLGGGQTVAPYFFGGDLIFERETFFFPYKRREDEAHLWLQGHALPKSQKAKKK